MQRRTTNTTMRLTAEFKGTILQIHRQAAKEHQTCQWIRDTVKRRVYECTQWKILTNTQQAEIFGYFSGLSDYFWHDVCENRVRYKNILIHSSEVPEGEWHNVEGGACVYRDSPQSIYADFAN